MNCWEQLGGIIAWEYEDAKLLGEHFFTVACYNLQHPAQFTDEAIHALRDGLTARIDEGISTQELRRRMSSLFEGKRRVLRAESDRHPVLKLWSMTIADVYLPDQPVGAAARVRQWAQLIREEM